MELNSRTQIDIQPKSVVLPPPTFSQFRYWSSVVTELRETFHAQHGCQPLHPELGSLNDALGDADCQLIANRDVGRRSSRAAGECKTENQKRNAAPKPGGGAAFSKRRSPG